MILKIIETGVYGVSHEIKDSTITRIEIFWFEDAEVRRQITYKEVIKSWLKRKYVVEIEKK